MSWVPVYGIEESLSTLTADRGGRTVAQSLSRLALQFWTPAEGGLMLDKRVNGQDIQRLTAVAKQNNLQVLLCVYNAYNDVTGSGFSWDRAKKAFAGNRVAFAQQIVDETERYGFDGVDLDIESERDGLTEQDRSDYAGFVIALAQKLHSRGKILTLSSFPGRWFGPNNTWWSDWAAIVDGMQSMGYSEVGKEGAEDWDSYQGQVSLWIRAGGDAKKFLNGVSVYFTQWKGGSTQQNLNALRDIAEATGSGVAVWELSLHAHPDELDPSWDSLVYWILIEEIKKSASP